MAISKKHFASIFIRHLQLCRAEQLIEIGERAQSTGEVEALRTVGARLFELSEGGALSDAAAFYTALALNHSQAGRAHAEAILASVASSGSPLYRAKSLIALGTNFVALGGDARTAKEYYDAGERLNPDDAVVAFMIRSQRATLASIEGDHRRALRDLVGLKRLAGVVGARLPFYRANHHNSLAFELMKAGDLEAAEAHVLAALGSPFAVPEFRETLREINVARGKSPDELAARRAEREQEQNSKGRAKEEISMLLKPLPSRDLWEIVAYLKRGGYKVKR